MASLKSKIRDTLYRLHLFTPIKKLILLYKKPLAKKRAQMLVKPILCKTQKIFNYACKQYWIDYGTLLGYRREGKLLKGDDDLDFGVIVKEGFNLSKVLEKEGFKLFKQVIVEETITFEQYIYNGFRFDIFYYREENGKFITNMWLPKHYNMPQHIAYKNNECSLSETTFDSFKTKEINFYDCKYYAPKDTDKYLSQHYGSDFLIPNPNFGLEDELNRVDVSKDYRVNFYD